MSYDLDKRTIYYPKNYKMNFSCNTKVKFTKELFDLNNRILSNKDFSLIYIIHILHKGCNYIKIGYTNSVDDFINKGGRFYTHTKNFLCDQPPILLKIFKCVNIDVELKLHKYIKENFSSLVYKVPYMKDLHECLSNETYLFDKNLFKDIRNIIQSIYFELNPTKSRNDGYIYDNGFINNTIIYIDEKMKNLENKENRKIKKFKFKEEDEKDKTNLDKYCGYESDDGFIVNE